MINLSNVAFEQSVLASLMSIDVAFDRVSAVLTVDHFTAVRHQVIYAAICALKASGTACDAVMVNEYLDARKTLSEAGGELYLMELLANSSASLFNVDSYAAKMVELALRRQSLDVIAQAKDDIANKPDLMACEVISDAIQTLSGLAVPSNKKKAISAKDVMALALEEYSRLDQKSGQSTGFLELDSKLNGGMRGGQLIVIAGRPSMGKTTLAMNVVEFCASNGNKPWLVISLEMTALQLGQRMQASAASVNLSDIVAKSLSEGDLMRWGESLKSIADYPLFINDAPAQKMAEIRAQAMQIRRDHGGIGGVMVDHIGIMGGINQNDVVNSIGHITMGLKGLAKELDCPVVALSQLNRGLEQRPNKRPVLSDLRSSGRIEEDADTIIFVYRDEYYNKESKALGIAEVIIGKNRDGMTGTLGMAFKGRFARFENLTTEWSDDNATD